MTPTLQLEDAPKTTTTRALEPKFLVEWTSRWDEFRSSIKPAFARSEARLAGEAPYGIVPLRSGIPTLVMEAFLVFAVIVVRVKVEQMRPYVAPRLSSRDVVYYTGDELPRTADLGGSESGTTGRAGGSEAHHRTQTIKIARGRTLTARVVDAPDLKLPSSRDAVANLLAVRPNAGPPPSEGLRSNRTSVRVSTSIVAPAPDVIRDYTRNGIKLDAVIPPAPSASHDSFQTAPNLSATVIPPAPSVSNDRTLVAPALAPTVVAPAPRVTRDRALASHSLDPNVVAPAPSVTVDKTRAAPALTANVIAPAPSAVSRQISSAPVQVTTDVVPPPVSAPERTTGRESKLNMPAPSVVAPPPSADVSQDMRRLASGSIPDPGKTVVPPPPTQSGSGSLMSAIIGKVFGASEVVPPPPSVNANGGSKNASLPTNVVAPPPSVAANTGGNPHGSRNGSGPALGSNVIAPPPSAGLAGGTGTRPLSASAAPTMGPGSVVPPPPSVAGPGGGTGETGGGKGAPGGTLLANNVVPPPPSVGTGANSSGSGMGRSGPGLGTAMDVGAPSTTPSNGGSGNNAGVVISTDAGSKVGLPTNGGKGSTAMSPTGGDKPGLGGTGSGTSIARGNGPGSSLNGEGPGAGKNGSGKGFDPNAHAGISTSAGPGGAGNATSGTPAVAGASIEGGSSVVTLPSFGADTGASEPSAPGHSSTGKQPSKLDVVVVATATSGGAFEPYKNLLHGQQYTTYLDTSAGTVVMEFAEETAAHASREPLASPQPIRTDLPDAFPHARMVLACTLDASGNLRNIRMLEPVPAGVAAKIMSALRAWKFQPAAHGDESVPVTAILGFGIDTNDRF